MMKNKKPILIAGLLVALLVVGVIGATSVYAQGPTTTPTGPQPPTTQNQNGPGHGRGFGLGQPELEAAAKALNMTAADLMTALQSGKTLEQVAQGANVDI